MQDDLATAPKPSRFELRHRRPLPKNNSMSDLQVKPIADQPDPDFPLPAIKKNSTLNAPPSTKNSFTSPLFLWLVGITLTAILVFIIIALISNL